MVLKYLSLDLVCILLVNDLLDGGGHQDVALLVEHVLSLVGLRAGEADDGAVVDPVVFQGLVTVEKDIIRYIFTRYLPNLLVNAEAGKVGTYPK